jgi:hypothetical protein
MENNAQKKTYGEIEIDRDSVGGGGDKERHRVRDGGGVRRAP